LPAVPLLVEHHEMKVGLSGRRSVEHDTGRKVGLHLRVPVASWQELAGLLYAARSYE